MSSKVIPSAVGQSEIGLRAANSLDQFKSIDLDDTASDLLS